VTTAGVILAGGLARRMGGGDKPRLLVGGRSILARTVDCLAPQVARLAINANGDPARFAEFGLPVLPDPLPDHPGPLAGVLAGLTWAASAGMEWVVSVSGDCPFLPDDLVVRLQQARGAAPMAVAASGGRTHPVVALWPVYCREQLREALLAGEHKVGRFTSRLEPGSAEWPVDPFDPFLNVNTPEDLARADRLSS
jgi:molybdopterin-guanine dinucleotide biosynthesis protein A